MSGATIQVYASLPRIFTPGPDLNLHPDNWRWVHCLTFPVDKLRALSFSSKPYKWMRYATGILVGAQGELFFSLDSPKAVDYDTGLPDVSTHLYYYTSDDEKQRMFPIDPSIERTHVTSSVATTRRADFRFNVATRDDNICVLTGMGECLCDAVHLVSHSKGDTYISTYTQRRSRDPAGGDIIHDIDSIRNGIFLNKLSHIGLGTDFAFLLTPNFAMDTLDVDPTAPVGGTRCTTHLFDPSKAHSLGGLGAPPSGTPLRISSCDWPPAILFEAVYAGAVLHHFGTRALKEAVVATWNDTFDPGGVMNSAHAESKANTDKDTTKVLERQKKAQEREARNEGRPDTFDMLLALPYILVPPNELQAALREAKEKAEAAERRRVLEKVGTWHSQILPP